MKKILNSVVFSLLFFSIALGNIFLLPKEIIAAAPSTIFSENFGTGGNTTTLPSGWSEGGDGAELLTGNAANSNNDSASLNGGRLVKISGEDGYICKSINTTGFDNVNLSYYWRGDNDAENSDHGIVEVKEAGSCSDNNSTWTPLQDYNLSNASWTSQPAFTNSILNNKNLLIRFRVASTTNNEDFRVDGILLTGEPVVSTGSINITKTTIGDNGTFSFTGDAGSFNLTTTNNTASTTRTNLAPGTYTISETAQTGWDITSNTCTSLVVTAGNTTNCVITNTKRGSISVYEDVVSPTEALAIDDKIFSVNLNGDLPQDINEFSFNTYENLTPGTYTINQSGHPDYDFLNFSIDTDTELPGAQVIVLPGENTKLVIKHKQKLAKIFVTKLVDNIQNLGTLKPEDFTLKVDRTINNVTTNLSTFIGGDSIETILEPGVYEVTEEFHPSYVMSRSEGCSGEIRSNKSVSCVVTNHDLAVGKGAIVVKASFINDHGGLANINNLDLFLEKSDQTIELTNAVSVQLNPGVYLVKSVLEEAFQSKYFLESFVCKLNENPIEGESITLNQSDIYYCNIVYNDKPAKLTIIKKLVNNAWNATLEETFNFNLTGEEDVSIMTSVPEGEFNSEEYNAIGQSKVMNLYAGNYTLTEDLLSEWNLNDVYCSNEQGSEVENGVSLSLSNGEEVTCTFRNTRKTGSLIIKKIVSNDDGKKLNVSDFPGFTINNSEPIPFIEDMGGDELTGGKTLIMQRGVYSISEPVTEGYYKVSENCDIVNIEEGETKTCSFRNDDVGFFVHSGGNAGGASAPSGSVLGASTEITTPIKEEIKTIGKVLGDATCTPYLKDFMKFGGKNDKEQVKLLQQFLNENLGLNLNVDGVYGLNTKNAVSKFQEKYQVDVLDPWKPFGLTKGKGTGRVYKTTLWKINALKCEGLEVPKPQLP